MLPIIYAAEFCTGFLHGNFQKFILKLVDIHKFIFFLKYDQNRLKMALFRKI
ncbi:hypothetical protein C723_3129 [Christiangramia flava JLT2011]|uniref:Uncharacterized protein n=1 Tax=Christiangramia flava JLT2011 TaxID=1229726 RepID=A0A1L7I025_9FLAO|nr:hypothetical protein GRFL_0217 [Christiangramia flava JLT2011]OSS38040.1 hypothetical protein C723_3129 [Christiangramia flava JLT2011]